MTAKNIFFQINYVYHFFSGFLSMHLIPSEISSIQCNVNHCHHQIRNHKLIAVTANIVKCHIKVSRTNKTYNGSLFNQGNKLISECWQNTFFTACGITNFYALSSQKLSPIARPASICPPSTDKIPARIISEI